jgi:HEAT repeat protein
MPIRKSLSCRTFVTGCAALALLLALAWGPGAEARAQRLSPVEEMEQVLRQDQGPAPAGLQRRREALEAAEKKLQTVGQLSQALLLIGWRDDQTTVLDPEVIKVDRDVRARLLKRFKDAVTHYCGQGDEVSRAAVATLLGTFAVNTRSGTSTNAMKNLLIMESFPELTGLLIKLIKEDKSPRVRAAAALAVGRFRAEPAATVRALTDLLKDRRMGVEVRRAAAEGLVILFRSATLEREGTGLFGEMSIPERTAFGTEVVRAAAIGLGDEDAEVRRLSALAFYQVAASVNSDLRTTEVLQEQARESGRLPERDRPGDRTAEQHRLYPPLLSAMWDQTRAVARVVNDSSPDVRLQARKILEEMGEIRVRWLRGEALLGRPSEPVKPAAGAGEAEKAAPGDSNAAQPPKPVAKEKLQESLSLTIPALLQGMTDPIPQNRLTAVEAIEAMMVPSGTTSLEEEWGGETVRSLAQSLSRALGDRDRFVRWASARTLGKIGPVKSLERGAVAGLARMLNDEDVDLRKMAAVALEQYGPAGEAAIPALIRTVGEGDVEVRIAAMRALIAMGKAAGGATQAIAVGLSDSNVRVRRAAADALSRLGPEARSATAALERALADPDLEVRQLASDALLQIQR